MSSLSEGLETGPAPSAEERAQILRSLPEAFARLAGVPAGHPRFPERLPFAAGDATGGSEIELQVVVQGQTLEAQWQAAEPPDLAAFAGKVGRRVTVEGVGRRIGESKSGDVLYVNFSADYRNEASLVLFVDAAQRAAVKTALEQLLSNRVRASGPLEEYKGTLQVRLREESDIRVIAPGVAGAHGHAFSRMDNQPPRRVSLTP